MNWIHFGMTLMIWSGWMIRTLMLIVVPFRRKPVSATAWLLVIFILPWPGLLLFLLIGAQKPSPAILLKHTRCKLILGRIARRFADHPSMVPPEIGSSVAGASQFIELLGQMPLLGGNHVELLPDTQSVFDRLIQDIDEARHHVHLLFYIYENDQAGQRVCEALERAVARGVICRVLVDALGSRTMLRKLAPRMMAAGIHVHSSMPVGLLRRYRGRVDFRNHRKVVVIDGNLGYTGSQNITDPVLPWRDLMARVQGPITLELQAIFVSDWYMESDEALDDPVYFPDPNGAGDAPLQVLPSGPVYRTENYQRLVVAALYKATKHVVFTTPYLIPDESLIQAIEMACLRGVKVEIIVPRRSDQILTAAAARAYFTQLLEMGVHLYQHQDGVLHSKTTRMDDSLCLLGSSNLDIRSFAINSEITLAMYGNHEVQTVRKIQDQYRLKSIQLTLEHWRCQPKFRTILYNLARLVSPLL